MKLTIPNMKIEFTYPGKDLQKLLDEVADVGKISIVEVHGQEYLVYVEKIEWKKSLRQMEV